MGKLLEYCCTSCPYLTFTLSWPLLTDDSLVPLSLDIGQFVVVPF